MLEANFIKKTKRLELRFLKESDYEAWKKANLERPKARNQWDTEPRSERELSKKNFKSLLKAQRSNRQRDFLYDFAIFDRKTQALMGFTSLMDISRAIFQNAYLGYSLISTYWGQGFAKEAVSASLDIAFKNLRLHRVEAGISPKNKRSLALAKSLGMRREGKSLRRLYLDGHWQDMVLYAMTAEERGHRSLNIGDIGLRR